jgi:mannosyl-oligosaccharide alpha-1,2-mannosidase
MIFPSHLAWLALAATAPILEVVASVGTIQKSGLQLPADAASNRQSVKTVFMNAYSAYKQYACTHDDLAPISAGFKDTRNGWGSTVFDALGTLKIMGENVIGRQPTPAPHHLILYSTGSL